MNELLSLEFQLAKELIESMYAEVTEGGLITADVAFQLNSFDLREWHKHNRLTDEEYKNLRSYNRTLYSEMPLYL